MRNVILPVICRRYLNAGPFRKKERIERIFSSVQDLCRRYQCTAMNTDGGEAPDKTKIFEGFRDPYGGMNVNSAKESCDITFLPNKLEESLAFWTNNKVRAVWFSVALEQAAWVPVLANNGFKFHHTKGDAVIMYRWLPKNEPCNIPPYAHTMIGVGGLVINQSGELLVVRERFHVIKPHWKLPGGYVEPGENIGDAAIREVFEETSVRTQFQFLVCFRHMHRANFGCSDIYFIASLIPLSEEIEKCNTEIDACVWMKVDEFLESTTVHDGNKFFVRKFLEYKNSGKSIGCAQGMHPAIRRAQCVYSVMLNEEIPLYQLQKDMS